MSELWRDLRYGMRSLAKSPALTFIAILALTLGIGVTTTVYSIVYGALLKGLPYPNGDRVASIGRTDPNRPGRLMDLSIQDYFDYKARQHTMADVGAFTSGTVNVSGTERAERFDGSWVTADVLRLTGQRPVIGRLFRAGEDAPSGERVAIISYSMWQTRYAADPSIVGKAIRVNGTPSTVVGVMPEGFAFPNNDKIWLPLQTDPNATKRGQGQFLTVVGMLKSGVTLQQASADVNAIAQRLAAEYPDADKGFGAAVQTFVDREMGPDPQHLLYTMLGAVFFVLLIACANVANLLLDRAAHRTKEVGIRTALGASRMAVIRQFFAESTVLALTAAVLGVALAFGGMAAFRGAIADQQIPFFIDLHPIHAPVMLFTIGVALVSALAAGAIPAIQASRTDINEILKDETRGASSFRIGKISRALVMFEIALSCGLLVAAGLMIKSVTKIRTMHPGFETKNVFTARVGFPTEYKDSVKQVQFFQQLEQRLTTLAGAQASAISSGLPGAQQGLNGSRFAIEGKVYASDKDYQQTRSASVAAGFFSTLQLPIVQGRALSTADRDGTLPVAVVNRQFVQRYFAGESAIGHRIRFGGAKSTLPWLTIVGVSGDVFGGDPNDPRPPVVFVPFAQQMSSFAYVSVRTGGSPMNMATPVRETVASLNRDIPLYWVMPLEKAISMPLWFIRVFGTMFMIFGVIALFLASIGLYAVMSFSVSRRIREVGIRMALGARSGSVVAMVVRQGALQLAVGMAFGLALALAIAQVMQVILFDVQPRDPTIFGGVALVLAATGVIASLIPARRATQVDPLVALRSE